MGGSFGLAIKGNSDILGTFRLAAVALLIGCVSTPRKMWHLSYILYRLSKRLSKYLFTVLAIITSGTIFRGLRQNEAIANLEDSPNIRNTYSQKNISVHGAPTPKLPQPPKPISNDTTHTKLSTVKQIEGQLSSSKSVPLTKTAFPSTQLPLQKQIPLGAIKSWQIPGASLLTPGTAAQEPQMDQSGTARIIERTLGEYGIEVIVKEIKPGPVVTMFGLVPGWIRRSRQVKEQKPDGTIINDANGKPIMKRIEEKTRVKVDSIVAREKDLALALAAPSLRIEAPIPGTSLVGIEVPNARPAIVPLRSIMETNDFHKMKETSKLTLALGKGSGGDVAVADLAKMPHLLIAGSTGSGKSVCMNAVIACIIMQNSPWETRLLLIDPKRVELTPYNGIPHLLTPVVVEVDLAVHALKGMVREMLRRYRIMEEAGARNIEGFNRDLPSNNRMSRIIICVDELADLMMAAAYDIEHSIIRLAQLGRATGIHLVVATQRPSVNVVTGLIKANFPSRISFAVPSQVDSRTILDAVGAEKLLGRGDMLFQPPDGPKPRRIQGVYLADDEIEQLVIYWKRQNGPLPPSISLEPEEDKDVSNNKHFEIDSSDELMQQAIELATHYNRLSTSLLQRRLRIGYPRAARLMDTLEDEGVIGPGESGKSREVLIGKISKSNLED